MKCPKQAKPQEYSEALSLKKRPLQAEKMGKRAGDQEKTVYKITNLVNGKIYVGCCTDISKRKYSHLQHARKMDYGEKNKLYPDIRTFGEMNFKFEIIEKCPPAISNTREAFWIKTLGTFPNGYNTTSHGLCGPGNWTGKKRPDISRLRVQDNKIQNAINATKIPVYCVETGKTFATITEAAIEYGVTVSAVARAIKDGRGNRGFTIRRIQNG